MVAHTYHSSTEETGKQMSEFEFSLVYIVSYSNTEDLCGNCLRKTKPTNQKHSINFEEKNEISEMLRDALRRKE